MGITDTIKLLNEAIGASKAIEAQRLVTELLAILTETQVKNAELHEKVTELESKLKIRDEVVFDERMGAYFKQINDTNTEPPLCSRCLDAEDKIINMLQTSGGHRFRCPQCKNERKNPDNPPPPPRVTWG